MTPRELYDFICSYAPTQVLQSICYTEKRCLNTTFCSSVQNTPVINFDKVKDEFYHGSKLPASVDAVTAGCQGTAFCFVELKGWQSYLDHLTKQKKDIAETAAGYNLAGKLADSQALCVELVKDPDLFAHIPVHFILVTDIDPDIDGIDYIHNVLVALGETSNELYSQCISESRKILESEIHIDKIYVQCRKFDDIIKHI